MLAAACGSDRTCPQGGPVFEEFPRYYLHTTVTDDQFRTAGFELCLLGKWCKSTYIGIEEITLEGGGVIGVWESSIAVGNRYELTVTDSVMAPISR